MEKERRLFWEGDHKNKNGHYMGHNRPEKIFNDSPLNLFFIWNDFPAARQMNWNSEMKDRTNMIYLKHELVGSEGKEPMGRMKFRRRTVSLSTCPKKILT